MAELRRIFVFHTTADVVDAGTGEKFELIAESNGRVVEKDFLNLEHDERECGLTDAYKFNVQGCGLQPNVRLSIHMKSGTNGWLPSAIWAIGETTSGDHCLLAHNPVWTKWFDNGPDAVGPNCHRIN